MSRTNDDGFTMQPERPPTPPVEVPFSRLSSETLDALIEAFILREGTDYGAREVSHEAKCAQVRQAVQRGEVRVVFDPDSQSINLLKPRDWQRFE